MYCRQTCRQVTGTECRLQCPAARCTKSTHRYLQVRALEKECAAGHVLYLQASVPRCQHTAIRGPLDPCEILRICVKVLPDERKTRQFEKNSLDKCIYFTTSAFGTRIISHAAQTRQLHAVLVSASHSGQGPHALTLPQPASQCAPSDLFMGLRRVCVEGDVLRHLAQGQLNSIPPSEAFPYTNKGSKFMPMPGVHQVCTQGLNHT